MLRPAPAGIVWAQACTLSVRSVTVFFVWWIGSLCYLLWWRGSEMSFKQQSRQGLEIYSKFLQTVAEFWDLESLPVSLKFSEEHDPETFLKNHAKWHKACHLKFAPSKLVQLQKRQLSLKSTCEQLEQTKSKRQITSANSDQDSCIFCSEVSGTLHKCATIKLNHKENGYWATRFLFAC